MTNSEPATTMDIVAMRPFVPAKDFETSVRFYTDLGFSEYRLGEQHDAFSCEGRGRLVGARLRP